MIELSSTILAHLETALQVLQDANPQGGGRVPSNRTKFTLRTFLATLLLAHSGLVLAEPSTELVVVGIHSSSTTSNPEAEIRGAMRKVGGFTLVGPQEVQERLRGRGSRLVDDALQSRGREALGEGKVLFEHADLEAAAERIGSAIAMLEDAMAGATDARYLIDALLVQGNIGLAMGNTESAKVAYRRVVELDPDRVLDSVHHSPKVVASFTEVRDVVRAEPTGVLEITSNDSEAQVLVDGRFRGTGTLVLRDVVPGIHHVLVTAPNGHRDYKKVTISPKGRTQVTASLDGYFIGQSLTAERDRSEQVSLIYRSLADQVTEGWILMAGTLGLERVGVQIYEARTGNFSKVIEQPIGGDPVESIASLTADLDTFRSPEGMLSTGMVSSQRIPLDIGTNPTLARVLFDSGTMPRSAATQTTGIASVPWPVWAGVGSLVVGGIAAAILLRSPEAESKVKQVPNETGTVVVRF